MGHPDDAEGRRRLLETSLIPALDMAPFIDGKFVPMEGSQAVAVRDTYQDRTVAVIPQAEADVVGAAVAAARRAFDEGPWPKLHPRERAAYLLRLADAFERRAGEFALFEALNAGRPISGVLGWDVLNVPEVLRYYAGWGDKITGDTLPDLAGVRISTYREPVGVCAAIMPWNFPLADLAWKLAPALVAGCTVVVKVAERAPLSTQAFAGLIAECDLPPGVVNMVTGPGGVTGDALVTDRRVDKISFTGSTATARRIVERTVGHLPSLSLELGGKSPNVIMADADLEAAADGAITAMFTAGGQDCAAGSRMLVDRPVVEEFLELLAPRIKARVVGDPLDSATQQGPLIDREQRDRVAAYVEGAVREGAKIVVGGNPLGEPATCFEPTLLRDVGRSSAVWCEEIFGPVAALEVIDGLDEALEIANSSEYALSGGIWTRSTETAERFVRELRAGTAWVNCYGWFDTASPWGGRGTSGQGKELGREGLDEYLTVKAVFRKGF